jgi:hypothetical protein
MAKRKSQNQVDTKRIRAVWGVVFKSSVSDLLKSCSFRFTAAFALSCIAIYAIINALQLALPGDTSSASEQLNLRTLGN